MDPDALLTTLREAVQESREDGTTEEIVDRLWAMADLVDNLDAWLTGGGFLPSDWSRENRP